MRLALAYAKTETLQYVRFPAYAIPTLAFPCLLMLLLGRQLERGEPARLLVGFAAMAVLTVTFFQFGVGIATTRTTPWEVYLRTLPAGPAARLAGRILSALGFAAASVAVVAVVGIAVHQPAMPIWRYGASLVALLAGSVPFALLGIALGYWLPPRAALPVANLAFLPLAVVGALWARPDGLPHTADVVSQLAPTRSWMETLDSVATGDHPLPIHHVAALVVWAMAFGALAVWGYRRDEGERFR
jgi:ABC-2 type transport system permease protein